MRQKAWLQATTADPDHRNVEAALATGRRLVRDQKEDGECWLLLGVALYHTASFEESEEALERSLNLRSRPDGGDRPLADALPPSLCQCEEEAHFYLAMVAKKLGRDEDARRRYDRAVALMTERSPDNEKHKRLRAEAEAVLGRER